MHTEAIQYFEYAAHLEATDAILDRIKHNGVEILHKMKGYYVGKHLFTSLQKARESIDRTQALFAFKNAFTGFPSILSNCLIYACESGRHEYMAEKANEVIKKLKLPLVALPTTFKTKDSFIVEYISYDAVL